MSSPPTIEPFKAANWEECNTFIRAIRTAAFKEGKSRDLAWVADFAGIHFSQKALTWHSRLPQDVRDDWAKLQVALLERWTPPEDDDELRTEPTPAAAPSLNRSLMANRPLQGALRVALDGSDTNFYVKLDPQNCGTTTNNANEALRVRCNSVSDTTLLERIDGSRHSWLAIQWTSSNPNLKKGSTAYAFLVFVDSLTLKSSWLVDTPYQLASCTFSTDGEVIPVWENSDTSKITTGIFCAKSGILCSAAAPDTYSRMYPNEKRVKIFIEPID